MVSQKKQLQVDKIVNSLKENPNFVLVSFGKTSHLALEELRRELKKLNANFKVIKNSLFQKAIARLSIDTKELSPIRDNSAILSLKDDFVTGLSAFFKQAKKQEGLVFKFGFLDKKLYHAEDLNKIAQLPPREQLLAKLIGSLKSPQTRVVYSLKFGISKLTYVIKTKGGETN